MKNKILKETLSWAKMIVISFSIILLLNSILLQAYRVQGESMEPTLENDDYTVILKTPHEYDYGDIVILDSRIEYERTLKDDFMENITKLVGKSPDYLWIKRVIGKPADKIEIIDGELFRNGQLINEPYTKEAMLDQNKSSYTVPDDHLFVLGDNRNYSKDSRYVGSIPYSNIVGKVILK